MAFQRDVARAMAPVIALGALATANRWLVLAGALCAWSALAVSTVRSPGAPRLVTGIIAAAIVASMDSVLGRGAFFVHLRAELPSLAVSVGVELVRGVFFAVCLLVFSAARYRIGFLGASLATGSAAFVSGYLFELIGASRSLWVWNNLTVPKADFLGVPAFAPVSWGLAFLLSGYYLSEPRRQTVPALPIISSGLRCGVGFCASFMLCWTVFLRIYGRTAAY